MSETPETDAAWAVESGNGLNEVKEISRKLERERDEARAGRQAYKQLAVKHAQERDEAREAFVIATDQMVIAQGKVREANKERDEAREIAQQLINIASHCLGWHENANPETITEAIKRWNASTKK
jgi:hypothetical protein